MTHTHMQIASRKGQADKSEIEKVKYIIKEVFLVEHPAFNFNFIYLLKLFFVLLARRLSGQLIKTIIITSMKISLSV